MAQVSAKRGGSKGAKVLRSITIEVKANGFEVTKDYFPRPGGKDGFPIYEPSAKTDQMVFTEPGQTLSYLEKCLGEAEHKAHEKSEGAHGGGY
jgi:hypothetical protein